MKSQYTTAIALSLAATLFIAWWSQAAAAQSGSQTPAPTVNQAAAQIGQEISIPHHLVNGDEYTLPLLDLLDFGERLFRANWTIQEGAGRPFSKGTGREIADRSRPLVFPRNFNRISGPDANSCYGCHNSPYGIAGGNGDIVTNVFVLGQRFDYLTFDPKDTTPMAGARDERGQLVDLDSAAASRSTLGMFGSGYVEMLARQMTADFRAIRDSLRPNESKPLVSKGVSFGVLRRTSEGFWDTSRVEGLPYPATYTSDGANPPDLIVRPFHQAGNLISIRHFTSTALNQHHGIQTEERFGEDPRYTATERFRPDFDDGDAIKVEATRADVTALTLFQAVMAVPGRVIPRDPEVEAAVLMGERLFTQVGCATCHRPELPLDQEGWLFSEPNPYNVSGSVRPYDSDFERAGTSTVMPVFVNLNRTDLPLPRLSAHDGVTMVPAYTDLKLHDITSGPDDPNREPLDMQRIKGSERNFFIDDFFAGNGKFVTRKLWGVGNKPNFYHHGKYTTMREAVLAHAGEAQSSTDRFNALSAHERDCLIEFLKTLQVLPPGTAALVVDETFHPRTWPPASPSTATAVSARKEQQR